MELRKVLLTPFERGRLRAPFVQWTPIHSFSRDLCTRYVFDIRGVLGWRTMGSFSTVGTLKAANCGVAMVSVRFH
jgi:hypothetical protein